MKQSAVHKYILKTNGMVHLKVHFMVYLMILRGKLDDMIVDALPCFFKDMSDDNRMMDPLNDTFWYSSQLTFTCSQSTIETPEKGPKYVQR